MPNHIAVYSLMCHAFLQTRMCVNYVFIVPIHDVSSVCRWCCDSVNLAGDIILYISFSYISSSVLIEFTASRLHVYAIGRVMALVRSAWVKFRRTRTVIRPSVIVIIAVLLSRRLQIHVTWVLFHSASVSRSYLRTGLKTPSFQIGSYVSSSDEV